MRVVRPPPGAGRYLEFATRDSPSANRTMSPSYVRWLAIAGIIIGAVGFFFFGVLAILIAIVLFGLSILGLAATVTGPDANSAPWLGTHVFCMRRRAAGQGAGLSPLRPRNRPLEPAEPVSRRPLRLVSCRAGNSRRKWARPDLDWRPSGYQPDAPTGLSYGPAVSRKKKTRLKRCLASDPIATASTTVSGSGRNSTYGFSSGE